MVSKCSLRREDCLQRSGEDRNARRTPVSNFNYGGATVGYGECYVFVVPEETQDFVLEITSLPPVTLTVL